MCVHEGTFSTMLSAPSLWVAPSPGVGWLADMTDGCSVTNDLTLLPAWFPYHSNYNQNISLSLELPLPGILSQQHKSRMQYIRFMLTSSEVDNRASLPPPPLFRHVEDSLPKETSNHTLGVPRVTWR